jgi:hypothetical protein
MKFPAGLPLVVEEGSKPEGWVPDKTRDFWIKLWCEKQWVSWWASPTSHVFSANTIRTGSSEKQGEPRPGTEAIPCFSASSLAKHTRRGAPTRVGAGHVLNAVKEQGWGLI